MGIKKIAQPMNKAKNLFVKWLKNNNATEIEVYECEKSDEWDYYRHVSAFVGEPLYNVYFTIWKGHINIDYQDGGNRYDKLSINEFLEIIS